MPAARPRLLRCTPVPDLCSRHPFTPCPLPLTVCPSPADRTKPTHHKSHFKERVRVMGSWRLCHFAKGKHPLELHTYFGLRFCLFLRSSMCGGRRTRPRVPSASPPQSLPDWLHSSATSLQASVHRAANPHRALCSLVAGSLGSPQGYTCLEPDDGAWLWASVLL